jgi:hypothetical protein
MKKKSIIIGIVIILLAVVAGGMYMRDQKEKEVKAEESAFWEKQKPRIELYFQYNFKDVKTFTYTKTGQTPMGIYIEGYINDNPKYDFSANVLGGEEKFNGDVSYSKNLLEDLGKYSVNKNVEEILKEQKESQ